MYLSDLIIQLRKKIPALAENYATKLTISSISSIGSTVTVETSTNHNLVVNEVINIYGTKVKTPISAITTDSGIATITTSSNHDQTKDYVNSSDQPSIVIQDCSISDYNGSFTLNDVNSRTELEIEIDTDPADANDGNLIEDLSYALNGVFTVDTIVDDTTFTVELDGYTLTKTGVGGFVQSDIRISGDVSIERFNSAYSKQSTDKYWLVVVPNATSTSKSRHVESDANNQHTQGTDFRIRLIPSFSIYLFIPSSGDLSGRESYDDAILQSTYIFSSILGFTVSSPYTDNLTSRIVLDGHETYLYNTSYYVHKFDFSTVFEIAGEDILIPKADVAMRDILLKTLNTEGEIIRSNNIKLDE